MKKVCNCGQEMYFDWGESGSQWDPPQPAGWYCSECGVDELATKEDIRIMFEEEERKSDELKHFLLSLGS